FLHQRRQSCLGRRCPKNDQQFFPDVLEKLPQTHTVKFQDEIQDYKNEQRHRGVDADHEFSQWEQGINTVCANRVRHSSESAEWRQVHAQVQRLEYTAGDNIEETNNLFADGNLAQSDAENNGEQKHLNGDVIFQELGPAEIC